MDEQTYLAQIRRCTRCPDMCACCCPVLNVTKNQSVSPSNKAHAAQMLAAGLLDPDPQILEVLYQCNNCRLCAEWCIYDDLVLGDLLKESRSRAVEQAPDYLPSTTTDLMGRLKDYGTPYAGLGPDLNAGTREKLEGYIAREGEILVFEGCYAREFTPDFTLSALKLLDRLEIKAVYLPETEPCCGAAADLLGFKDQALRSGREASQFIQSSGVDRVVALDPLCAYQLTAGFAGLGIDQGFEVLTLPAFLDDLIRGGLLRFKDYNGGSLVLDDDPVLARYLDQAELPYRLLEGIPGCSLVRTQKSGSWSEPAFSCSPLPDAETSRQVTSRKYDQLVRTGAERIVATSPRAYQALSSLAQDPQQVIDLPQLFSSALH